MANTKGIYKFRLDSVCGFIDGIFIAYHSDIRDAIGREVDYGEALGEHSEIISVLSSAQLRLMTSDRGVVAKFEELELATGHNPLDYLDAQDGV